MNALDIFVIAVIVLSGIYGLVRGFVRTFFSVISTILVIVLTLILTPIVSDMVVENTQLDEKISEQVIYLTGIENIEDQIASKVNINQIVEQLPIPENMAKTLIKTHNLDFGKDFKDKHYAQFIGDKVASIALNYLIFVVLFLVISTILNIIVLQIDLIARLPILKQLNRTLGLAFGLFLGVLIVWISCLMMTFLLSVQSTKEISVLIEQSIFMKLFFLNNPIQDFVMKLL